MKCKRGPKAPANIPIIIGPPAIPNRIGDSMPGRLIGIVPNAKPRIMPRKITARLGSLRVLTELPKNFSAWSMASG